MVLPLTKIENVPDKATITPGMAYFAGTGPALETCGTCKHFGYYREKADGKSYRVSACWMFKKLTGKYGPRINRWQLCCKYHEKK